MRLIYIDESKDIQNDICAYSALCINSEEWHPVFDELVEFRRSLKSHYSIPVTFEMHASDFTAGRGKYLFNSINRDDRITIYKSFISVAAKWTDIRVLNAIGRLRSGQFRIFEWLIKHLDTMLRIEGGYGLLICDEGDNSVLTKVTRKMRKGMVVPSKSSNGIISQSRNIVEDPVFKDSCESYFIQLVDFIVHAFLRFEYPLKNKAFLEDIFLQLEPVLYGKTLLRDVKKLGIIRVG